MDLVKKLERANSNLAEMRLGLLSWANDVQHSDKMSERCFIDACVLGFFGFFMLIFWIIRWPWWLPGLFFALVLFRFVNRELGIWWGRRKLDRAERHCDKVLKEIDDAKGEEL